MFERTTISEIRANQPFYETFEVNNFKFPLPGIKADKQDKLNLSGEVSEQIAYEQLFRIIVSFEKKAEKLENEGNRHRAEFLRNFLQTKADLSREQADALKIYAKNFTTEIGRIKKSYETARQTENLFQSEVFERERTRLFSEYRNHLKGFLGENGFESFAEFVQKKITSRLSYRRDEKSNRVLLSMSMVEYSESSDEVLGYSYTDQPHGQQTRIWNIVEATLTSDLQGLVDSDWDEQCNEVAEAFLFISGTSPEETFCVDGFHAYAEQPIIMWRGDGRPKIPRPETVGQEGYDGCYAYQAIDALPPSDDCLTTPPAPNVTEVTFQTIAPNTPNSVPIDNDPNDTTGEGQRIFPDDDFPMENQNRQRIRVVANISAQKAGVRVYFQSFDLDDPSTDMTIDPNGNAGDDNNGMPRIGQLHTASAVTNSSGVATVEFSVTMQPGDNFAIVAATDQNDLSGVSVNGIDLTGSNGTIQTVCDGTDVVCRSRMLTVWRRLHIEVDSMGESQGNFVVGSTQSGGSIRTFRQVTIPVNVSNPLEINRFENGRINFVGSSPFDRLQVIGNTADTVTVRNIGQMTASYSSGNQFQLYDDDDFDDDDGTQLDGDTGEDIPRPDTTLISNSDDENSNVFAPAYIRPAYDLSGESSNVAFAANTGETEITNLFNNPTVFNNRATEADVEFWTIYLLGGYQFRENRDGDPYTIVGGFLNTVWGAADTGERQTVGQGAILFTEEGRTREYPPDWASRPVSRAHTVAHEVGHLFGCIHADSGLMADTTRRTSGTLPPPCLRQIRIDTTTHP